DHWQGSAEHLGASFRVMEDHDAARGASEDPRAHGHWSHIGNEVTRQQAPLHDPLPVVQCIDEAGCEVPIGRPEKAGAQQVGGTLHTVEEPGTGCAPGILMVPCVAADGMAFGAYAFHETWMCLCVAP